MWLKAWLFVAIGAVSSITLLTLYPSWRVALLLLLAIWGFSRAYYFAFYVVEHWIDPGYRYAGLWDFIRRRLLTRADRRPGQDSNPRPPRS